MFASKIFSGRTKANPVQLYPRDILKYSRMISGDEVNNEIAKVGRQYVTYARSNHESPIHHFGMKNPINVLSGDTIEFSWSYHFEGEPTDEILSRIRMGTWKSPGKVIFHSTGAGSVYTHTIHPYG